MISDYMGEIEYENQDFGRNIYNKHIYRTAANNFIIRKSLNGKQENYGTYPSMDEARKVRDYLISNGWDKQCIQERLDEQEKSKNYYKYIHRNNRYYAISGVNDYYMGQVKTIEEALYYRDIIHKDGLSGVRPKDFDLITDNPYLDGLEYPLPERLVINNPVTDYGKGSICKKGEQSYHVWYGSTYYCACPTYEMAYYMKQELNKVGWDKNKVEQIKSDYPVWYTWLMNFYKYIVPDNNGTKRWAVNITNKHSESGKLERITFTKLEDALWERDLLLKYGFDEELLCECADDSLNPYYGMELPPYPQRKVRRIKEREPRTELFNTFFETIQEEPNLSQEEYCKVAGLTSATFRLILRHEFDSDWEEFKLICESGENPNDVLVQKPLIYNPDLSIHREGTNVAVFNRLKNKFVVWHWENDRSHYYGAYPTRDLAERIVKELKKVDWDKNQLKEIQEKCGWQSMVGSKRWVYANKYPTRNGKKISSYSVRHKNKDKKMINFGSYKDKRVAELVRDFLILEDWDKNQLDWIKEYSYYVISCVDNCWRCKL